MFSDTDLPQTGGTSPSDDTWVISSSFVNEIRFGYNYAYHLNAPISLDGRNWVGRHRPAQPGWRRRIRIDYGRPGLTMTGFSGNGEGGITQGATENIYSVSNATSWVKGGHNIRFGLQAQFRKFEHLTEVPPRGGFTFNGQFTGNPVADFLLGYCSTCTGAFGSSRSTYHSPTIAPFIDDNWQINRRADAADGHAVGVSRALARGQRHRGRVRSGDRARSRYHKLPAKPARRSWCRSIINQDNYFPAGHPAEGSEQLGAARRSSRTTSTTGRLPAPDSACTTTT